MLNMAVVIPSKELIVRYSNIVRPMYERRSLNLEESRSLASIRDTLLPRLVSGELKVKDVEKVAEALL
jgi:type I restriction enzyme S subunit